MPRNRDTRALLERIADVTPGALLLVEAGSGAISWHNLAAARIFGEDYRFDAPGAFAELVVEGDREVAASAIDRVRLGDGDEVVQTEQRMVTSRGETRWVECRYVAFDRTDSGEVEFVLLTALDVTDSRELRAQLAVAARLASVGTLAAGVAHEVNNPLTYVLFNLAHIKRELDRPGTGHDRALLLDCIRDAITGANRVRDIVWDIKAFSAVRTDAIEPVDIKTALDGALSIANNQLRHRAHLELAIPPGLPPVLGATGQLSQLFLNLLLNAIQAIPEGEPDHTIRVAVTESERSLRIDVIDDGVGIPDEHRERLFDPFFSTRDLEGAGLGLSICHGIVSGMGGRIWLENNPDGGTVASVELPLPAEKPWLDDDFSSDDPTPTPNGGRVLVIDDDKLLGKALARVVSGHFEITVAPSGAQAIEILRTDQKFDLVLCDLMMPGMSGMDVYEWVKRSHPELVTRICFMTGGAFSPRASELLQNTTHPIIEKPFDVGSFPQLLRALARDVRERRPTT